MGGRLRDPNQLANLIVDIATGEAEDTVSEKKRHPVQRKRLWIAVRFIAFLPVATLFVLGYILAGMVNLAVFMKEGRATIGRFWMSWWHWVIGEISTYDLIR